MKKYLPFFLAIACLALLGAAFPNFIGTGGIRVSVTGQRVVIDGSAVAGTNGGTVYGSNVVGAVAQSTHSTNSDNATSATSSSYVTTSPLTNQVSGANVIGVVAQATHATNADNATTVTQSPLTNAVTNFSAISASANTVLAGPTTGAAAAPSFRALVFADLPALQLTNNIGITVDGGGSVLTTGQKGYIRMPYTGTLRRATVMADQNGSLVFDVWKSTTFPPTVANTITASAKPTLTSTNWVTDSTLTGWTNSFVIGDYIGWNVDSASAVTRATLQLDISH